MSRVTPGTERGSEFAAGELVKVLEDDRHNAIYWYQTPGVFRRMEGVQVFLDPKRRTHAETGGEVQMGLAPVPKPR